MAQDYVPGKKIIAKPSKKGIRDRKKVAKRKEQILKDVNKKPLPPRSRSGAASGRGGSMRGGLGGGLFGPRVR